EFWFDPDVAAQLPAPVDEPLTGASRALLYRNHAAEADMHDEEDDDLAAFRDAMRDVRPIAAEERVERRRRPRPVPRFSQDDEARVVGESLANDPYAMELETGEELLYLRDGANPKLLRRLRRGEFRIEAEADLH